MKVIKYLIIAILSCVISEGISQNSDFSIYCNCEKSKDLSKFKGQAVSVLYRGVHFCKDIFPDNSACDKYIKQHMPGVNVLESLHIYSSYQNILKYTQSTVAYDDLMRHQILNTNFMFQQILRKLKQKNNMVLKDTNYIEYHSEYSNKYSSNHRCKEFSLNKYGTQFEDNPFLSFSKTPKHALKYAYAVDKQYSTHFPLEINFNNGIPEIDTLGVIQVVFIRQSDLYKLGVCDVNQDIGKPGQRKFLENEVSLDGFAFPENFVFQCKAKLPKLNSNSDDCKILGISEKTKKNWYNKTNSQNNIKKDYVKTDLIDCMGRKIEDEIKKIAEENQINIVSLIDLKK